jgi:hypothetical protein
MTIIGEKCGYKHWKEEFRNHFLMVAGDDLRSITEIWPLRVEVDLRDGRVRRCKDARIMANHARVNDWMDQHVENNGKTWDKHIHSHALSLPPGHMVSWNIGEITKLAASVGAIEPAEAAGGAEPGALPTHKGEWAGEQ